MMFTLTSIMMSLCIPASAQHEFVDLGLSVKWATCNVGASKPEEVGGLFAWGETETDGSHLTCSATTAIRPAM